MWECDDEKRSDALPAITMENCLDPEVILAVYASEDFFAKSRAMAELQEFARQRKSLTLFNRIVKDAVREIEAFRRSQREVENNDNHFTQFTDCDYPPLRCGAWVANDRGVVTYAFMGMEIVACYHPIMPVATLKNAETGMEKVTLAYRRMSGWREITVAKGVIASANKIVALADFGIAVTSETAKHLVKYLADVENANMGLIPEQISTSKLGWVNGEFMPYCDNIVFDDEQRFKALFESVRAEGSWERWLTLAKDIRRSGRIEPKFYLAGALASVLLSKVNGLPFIINLWGETGKGKTVAIMYAASVWANPAGHDFVGDPKSTQTALELRMNCLNSLPMLIDDMAQVKNRYDGDFSEFIYYLCSGKGKDRANQSLGLNKPTSWENAILTNGERPLTDATTQGGAINRVLDIEMAEGYIFADGNKTVEVLKANYGHLGIRFLEAIREIGDEQIRREHKEICKMIKTELDSAGEAYEEKQVIPMAAILLADKIATDHIILDGQYIELSDAISVLKSRKEVSECERAYEYIVSDVSVNHDKYSRTVGEPGERWGVLEEDCVYIHANIMDKYAKQCNFSKKSFLSWADRNGVIRANNGRTTIVKKVNGRAERMYCITLPDYSDEEENQGFEKIDEKTSIPFA